MVPNDSTSRIVNRAARRGMSGLPPLPPSNLLIVGRAIPLMPRLVQLIGLNEAIVLQQVRYLLDDERRPAVRDGRRWAVGSYAEWQRDHFPFWHPDTVERAFRSLERQGVLTSAAFNASRRDHTKWYTVDFDRLLDWERICRAALGAPALPPDPYRPAGPDELPVATGSGRPLPPIPATDLLLDEHPLLLLPRLAVMIGFDEAIALQQVRYWLADHRRPLIREGRRWVRFNQEQWHAQISFRSKATVARAFRRLEETGLLIASSRLNPEPGDRTKAYTIDFGRLEALQAAGGRADTAHPLDRRDRVEACGREIMDHDGHIDQAVPDPDAARFAAYPAGMKDRYRNLDAITVATNTRFAADHERNLQHPKCGGPEYPDNNRPPAGSQSATNQERKMRRARAQRAAPDEHKVPPSLEDKTPEHKAKKTGNENLQQQRMDRAAPDVVVAVDSIPVEMERRLLERGISRITAGRLVNDAPPELVARQIAIYDWLRDQRPDDVRLTPGRLRRMIEEDWAIPPGYVAATQRSMLVRSAIAAAWSGPDTPEGGASNERAPVMPTEGQHEAALSERQSALEAIGATSTDQVLWERLALDAPRLPPLFRGAIFHAPQGDEPAALVFPDRAACERAQSPAYAAERQRIARRIGGEFRRPWVRVLYLAYEEVLRLLTDASVGQDVAAAPASPHQEASASTRFRDEA